MKQILGKLHKIMTEVDYIQKDSKNSFQKYSYASEKAIKEKLHSALVDNKVILQLSTTNARVENNVTCLDCIYTFHDVESGETLTGTFVGTGSARDEKGNYAAVTGAIKYILTSTFLIPTGDDPEDDKNEPPKAPKLPKAPLKPTTPTKDQLNKINELAYNKLEVTTDEEILPAINKALGTAYGRMTIATNATIVEEIITKLTNL